MQTCMGVWECPLAAETQQVLYQTSTIVDPLMRSKLTHSMLNQLAKEQPSPHRNATEAAGHGPRAQSSGCVRRRRSGSDGSQLRGDLLEASYPLSARSSSSRAVPAATISAPRPRSAPSCGRQGRSAEGANMAPRCHAPALGSGRVNTGASGRQWLPPWITPGDWAEITDMERRSPTMASWTGRQEWLSRPPCHGSFARPWACSYASPGTRAGHGNINRPFP